MSCNEIEEVLPGYLDGELDLVRSMAIEQHLKECPACARAHREGQSLRTAMAGKSLYFDAPKGLERRVRSAVRQASKAEARAEHRPSHWNWTWSGALVPLVAAAMVILIAFPLVTRQSAEEPLVQEILSSHLRSLIADTSHLTDVASSDQHTVKPWFTGKLPFSPPVTDLATKGFVLVGGRLDYIGDQRVAALVYQRRQHFINLFISPSNRSASTSGQFLTRHGYNLLHWLQGDMEYWAVSDVNKSDLQQFVQFVRAAAPSGAVK